MTQHRVREEDSGGVRALAGAAGSAGVSGDAVGADSEVAAVWGQCRGSRRGWGFQEEGSPGEGAGTTPASSDQIQNIQRHKTPPRADGMQTPNRLPEQSTSTGELPPSLLQRPALPGGCRAEPPRLPVSAGGG